MLFLVVIIMFFLFSMPVLENFESFDMPFTFVIKGQYRDLCLDAGSSNSKHRSARMWKCDVKSPRQQMTYEFEDQTIQNQGKCLDDGGAIKPGVQPLRFETCDGSSNQTWDFDSKAVVWRNPSKNLCLHDGNGYAAGLTSPTLWSCDSNNRAQRYIPKSLDACF